MRGHWIGGCWIAGEGPTFDSDDPATGRPCWSGRAASAGEVAAAVVAARRSCEEWRCRPIEDRARLLEAFATALGTHRRALAEAISVEVGKPLWESLSEVDAMIGKVPLTLRAWRERHAETAVAASGRALAATRWQPLGVVAVFGPFNFPGHLPNGHIVPALLAGNTVVFKPSELTPLVAERTVEVWIEAGLPGGVLNLVQGGRDTGAWLAAHPGIDGVLFTGSFATGRALARALSDRPQLLLALEMGGNNPLVVHQAGNLDAAASLTVQSAFLTAGQRCTAARRLVVVEGAEADRFVERLAAMTRRIRTGPWTANPEPFMGPVVQPSAADAVLDAYSRLVDAGARPVVPIERLAAGRAFLSPGVLDVTDVAAREDEEIFGPLLQLVRVADFDAAIEEANRTSYGLVAGLVCDRRDLWERFERRVRAGLVHWNRPTTGASSSLPFGGVGKSGNHRPSGFFAVDYCVDPIAVVEHDTPVAERLHGLDE
jgi:succinylglutamic semialdehyde dehydrogenase